MRILLIDQKLLDETSQKAAKNVRLRMNYNIHSCLEDPVNRMLNALEPGSYFRPHRHLSPPKAELSIVLRGELDVLIFDNDGDLLQRITLNPEIGNYGIDISSGIWHSLIVKKTGTVVYEVKEGPFSPIMPEDFASWGPDPNDEAGIKTFFEQYSLV